MNTVDYIYEFLHDPRKTRWPQPVIDYLLQAATADITTKVEAFLKSRELKRKAAQLKQLGTHDETVSIQLEEGKDIYDLPEDFLRVSSVIYNSCFIPHQIPTCSDGVDCGETTPDKIVRAYNTSGLPKGKLMVSPMPSKHTKEEITIEHVRKEELNEESLYGWGLFNIPSNCVITEEDVEVVNTCEIMLGSIEVTYEVQDTLEFPDNDDEVLEELTTDAQLLKFYTCGHLLRDDKDSNSRSLGAEELQLYEKRVVEMLNKYIDLYDVNNTLELSSADEGYVDTKTNKDVLLKDDVAYKESKLEEQNRKQQARSSRKSKFDTLGGRL